jgi:phage host-nuclease inhibitor protein Gam
MTMRPHAQAETVECPLCLGEGRLKRTEVLDRLGVKDFARVAQLSAGEAFRLLQSKHDREHQTAWSRFETELAKRTAEIRERHGEELRMTKSERDDLTRRVEDCLREVGQLRERNQELEGEMSKAARRGKLKEISFEEEARSWAGIHVSEKLARGGDYILAYRDPSGTPLEPRIIVDSKDKSSVTEGDLKPAAADEARLGVNPMKSSSHRVGHRVGNFGEQNNDPLANGGIIKDKDRGICMIRTYDFHRVKA